MSSKIATLTGTAVLLIGNHSAVLPQTPSTVQAVAPEVGVNAKVDAFSIAELKIGMTEQEVVSVYPDLVFKDRGPIRQAGKFAKISEVSNDLLPEANGQAILELNVLEGRLVNISVRWLPASFDLMLLKLRDALGTPANEEKTQHSTQAGERFTNTVALWVGERTVVRYFQHFENIKQSRILLMERTEK